MGATSDHTKEHLLSCDNSLVRVRRLLLQTLKDMEAGEKPPGSDAAHYRARSLRFVAPTEAPFAELVEARVWGNQSAAAE